MFGLSSATIMMHLFDQRTKCQLNYIVELTMIPQSN